MKSIIITFIFLSFNIIVAQSQSADEYVINLSKDIVLNMKIVKFDPSKHIIDSCQVMPDPDGWGGICLIDHKPVFGADWRMPRTILDEIYVLVRNVKIPLDASCMYNPFPGGISLNDAFSYKIVEGGIVVKGSFSDGAGFYIAEWLIINNKSVRILIEKR
jgi:hypothetical protein